MNNLTILQQYQAYLSLLEIKPRTKQEKNQFITQYIDFLGEVPIVKTDLEHIESYISSMDNIKSNTAAKRLSMLKMFYVFLEEYRYIPINLSGQFPKQKRIEAAANNLSLSMTLKLCEPLKEELPELASSVKAIRNQAILEFLVSTGVRNTELRQAKLKDLAADLTECLIATEKGGPNRTVYLGRYARASLYQYLNHKGFLNPNGIQKAYRETYIFTSTRERQISINRLRNIIRMIGIRRIGCPVTPLMLRHTFATEMLKATRCLRSVQELMGHERISSTVRYCHYDTADKRTAIDTYHPRGLMEID